VIRSDNNVFERVLNTGSGGNVGVFENEVVRSVEQRVFGRPDIDIGTVKHVRYGGDTPSDLSNGNRYDVGFIAQRTEEGNLGLFSVSGLGQAKFVSAEMACDK
jgi:hypothetical protein